MTEREVDYSSPQNLAERIADYVETAITYSQWSKREAMLEAVRIAVEDAFHDTALVLSATHGPLGLGRADWKWDDDLSVHIPCCTRWVPLGVEGQTLRRCGNGPLTGDAIRTGDCGEHKDSRQDGGS